MGTFKAIPIDAAERINRLGQRVRLARSRRSWSNAEAAVKAGINRNTLSALEFGKPGVAISAYVTVPWVLGLEKSLDGVAHPDSDIHGKALEHRTGRSAFAKPTNQKMNTTSERAIVHVFAHGAAHSIPDTIMRSTYVANYQAIQVAMIGTQTFGIRLAELLAFSPLIVLAYAAAMADGLVERSIPCAGGGNESANVYHRTKYFQILLIASIGAVCLILPASIDFRQTSLPLAGLLGLAARYQWANCKKHL